MARLGSCHPLWLSLRDQNRGFPLYIYIHIYIHKLVARLQKIHQVIVLWIVFFHPVFVLFPLHPCTILDKITIQQGEEAVWKSLLYTHHDTFTSKQISAKQATSRHSPRINTYAQVTSHTWAMSAVGSEAPLVALEIFQNVVQDPTIGEPDAFSIMAKWWPNDIF